MHSCNDGSTYRGHDCKEDRRTLGLKADFIGDVQGAEAISEKYTRIRKNNTAQLIMIRFYSFKKNIKTMVII